MNMTLNCAFLFTLFVIISCKKDILNVVQNGLSANQSSGQITKAAPVEQISTFDAALNKRGDLSAYAKVPGNPYTAMVINPGCISIVNDPVYDNKRKVMLMTVNTQETGGLTANPRTQVQTPMDYVEGQEVYAGFSVRFKSTIWTYFLTFAEFYGAPYQGTSPFRLGIQESNITATAFDGTKQTNLWKEPMETDVWYDFVYREVLSKDAAKGKVQVWLRKQGETDYKEILPATSMATITKANLQGPNYHKLACYYDKTHTFTNARKQTQVNAVQMYMADHKVGKNFGTVAPALIH